MVDVPSTPITVALIDDYDVVLIGLAHMFDGYTDQIVVAEIDANASLNDRVDIALYDTFAQSEADCDDIDVLIRNPRARRAVVYTWNFQPDLVATAMEKGASGYLSKTLPARALVDALLAIHAGELVVSPAPAKTRPPNGLDWPGRAEGLTNRESEILALITQGRSNDDVAALTFLSKNSIKSYIRSTYRKIGAASRTQAVLWGIDHGFKPDNRRIDHWRDGP
jgi:NarL family two-component system response regulator LiaR